MAVLVAPAEAPILPSAHPDRPSSCRPELSQQVRSTLRTHSVIIDSVDALLDGSENQRSAPDVLIDTGETILKTGLTYRGSEPVQIRVRRRGRRYDITDDGVAVSLAGKPRGWLDRFERVVSAEGFNVNRRGALFVPAVEGRDIASLAIRLPHISRSAYLDLLEMSV